jgi:hypothetical protein
VTSLAGLVVGIFAMLFVPAILPGSTALGIAGFITGQSYWNAGQDMMKMGNESRFNDFLYADSLCRPTWKLCRRVIAKRKIRGKLSPALLGSGHRTGTDIR